VSAKSPPFHVLAIRQLQVLVVYRSGPSAAYGIASIDQT
jgi:hypothetical protein